jgi:hypothetical protein
VAKAYGAQPLHASRPVLNAESIIAHYKALGMPTALLPDDMHVTVMYDPEPTHWDEDDHWFRPQLRVEGGARSTEMFGGGALVLAFDCAELVSDWLDLRWCGYGGTWPSFRPHITLTYNVGDGVAMGYAPYTGPIVLGPMRFTEGTGGPGVIVEKLRPEDMLFSLPEAATTLSKQIGLGGETHLRANARGDRLYAPGKDGTELLKYVAAHNGTSNASASVGKLGNHDLTLLKSEDEQRMVWGWASVVTSKGSTIYDTQGDSMTADVMEKAATDFMLNCREGHVMHLGKQVATVVHSLPITKQVAAAFGLTCDVEGWAIAMKVHDDDTWALVKAGVLPAFSIGGEGQRNAAD